MLRRPGFAALLCAVTTAGVLTGCDRAAPKETDSDRLATPTVGACRALTVADLSAASNDSTILDCTRPHTAQTFVVGELPATTGTRYDDRSHGRFVYDRCQQAFGAFLGADESTVLRSQLSWSWFRPSKKGWERGARWFRCDVVGGPEQATALRDLPHDARGLFAEDFPDAWMTCARGETAERGSTVPCDQAHDWRAVTTVQVAPPAAAYPGDRIVEVRSRDYCRDSVRGWLGYPPDFDYSYTWFREDRWDSGNHRSLCWARTAK
ncbi:MAG: septum formation family protein [Propionibacteriales bacterium]|nr:septum formation family protein [Propionibacteriales bacterium]